MIQRVTFGILLAAMAWPQGQAFDVAAIKQSKVAAPAVVEGGHRENIEHSPVSLTMRNVSLETCIEWAWGVQEYQISGPEGVLSEKYDIAAKTGTPVSLDRMKLMLQTLLAQRLNLTTHRGTKEIAVYALAPAKSGPKLSKATGARKSAMNRIEGSLVFHDTSMSDFAGYLSTLVFVGRPVIDWTGIEGVFDFTVRFGATNEEMRRVTLDGDGASFFTLIQEQLGLKLEPRRSAVETIVVDRADKLPKPQ
jgi:uncharacterized protein (TIGR03435 family)